MDVRGKRVTVMGLGLFGGGVGVARFLARRGAKVTITDLKPAGELQKSLAALGDLPIAAYHLAGHQEADFAQAELVVVNPGVPKTSPYLKLARRAGARLTTEINLFFADCRGQIIGVTGSNGKSTTAAMIHAILARTPRRAWLGGNIGGSLLEDVDRIGPEDCVVLELSSFQLQDLRECGVSPAAAVVTTFTANHLDRHANLDEYRQAKQGILAFQSPDDLAVLNQDDPEVASWRRCTRARVLGYGLSDSGGEGAFLGGERAVFRLEGREARWKLSECVRVPGRHNLSNALAAAACAMALGAGVEDVRRGLCGFHGLPHRLQLAGEVAGRRFYNDSIATTPESTLAALEAFGEALWVIVGGSDKGLDLSGVAEALARRARGVAAIGQTGPRMLEFVRGLAHGPHVLEGPGLAKSRERGAPALQLAGSLSEAVEWCFARSAPGDVILLSPACASFGLFQNFADRGTQFCTLVAQLAHSRRAS